MKNCVILVLSIILFFAAACTQEHGCEQINKSTSCVAYNNCNVLESWRLLRIEKTYTVGDTSMVKKVLYRDNLLMYADGSMELRFANQLSPLNKWEFTSCTSLKLFSSNSDSVLVTNVVKMEAREMQWQFSATESDSAVHAVLQTLYFQRM